MYRKEDQMNQKKTGVLLSYTQIFITLLVTLLYTPIMLRILGASEYGVYSLSSSVIGYLALLYAGMASTYLRYYSSYQKDKDEESIARLNGLFIVLFSVLGGCALTIGLILSINLQPVLGSGLTEYEYELARVLFVIMSINMALLMPKTVFSTLIISQEKFIFIKLLELIQALLTPVITLPLLYLGYGSIGMSCVVLFFTAIGLVASMWYCVRKLNCPFQFNNLPFSLLPGMFSFSIFIFLQVIMDQFNWQLGKVLLSNFTDSTAIAVYSVGLQISLLFISFSVAFSGVMVPRVYQLVKENKSQEITNLWLRVGRYQFFVVCFIWISFFVFGRGFLVLWVGRLYEDAYVIVLLLVAPMLIHLCQLLAIEVLRAHNKHKTWTLVHLGFSIIGFLICVPLTKEYGVLGIAWGTSITTFIVLNIYDNWYYYKAVRLDVGVFFRGFFKLVPAALLCVMAGWGINELLFTSSWGSFFLAEILFMGIYVVVMYFVGMNSQEKMMVKRIAVRCKVW